MLIKVGYIALSVLMVVLILLIGFKAIKATVPDSQKAKQKRQQLIGGLLLWHLFIFLIGVSGFLADYSLPPRFPIVLILPAFTFTGIFLYRQRDKAWVTSFPPHWLLFYQSFRILIESLFVVTVAAGWLHANVTIEGYNYDMIYAYSAPIIGWLLYKNPVKMRKLAITWNYTGLAVISVIIFLFITTMFFPQFYGSSKNIMPLDMAYYPFVVVGGFLMPSAVFMHVLSIIQLKKLEKDAT